MGSSPAPTGVGGLDTTTMMWPATLAVSSWPILGPVLRHEHSHQHFTHQLA
jgi:hypothetical protein